MGRVSISVSPRIIILPLPVSKYSLIPSVPKIKPPVGKSGPLIYSSKSNGCKSGLSIRAIMASQTSPILWGGILVAIPTAIPEEPFTSKLGNRAGKTVGS